MRSTVRFLLAAALAGPARAQEPPPTSFAGDRPDPPLARLSVPVLRAKAVAPPSPAAPSAAAVDALFGTTLPIDLPSVLRLANASSPAIALAQVRVREALARVDQALALRLPTLQGGGIYNYHQGLTQNNDGLMISVTKQSLFGGGGATLRVGIADAVYEPLVARRLAAAETAAARADTNNALLEAVSAYFDLIQAHAQLGINGDVLKMAEQILQAARAGEKQGLIRTPADVNRAETEVSVRRVERQELRARVDVASARLVRLLVLDPTVTLVPADPAVVPVELFGPETALPDLIEQALRNRPEMAAAAARIEAADVRYQQAKYGPLLPRVQATYLTGEFSGGRYGAWSPYEGRGDVDAQLFWELRGLGFGNLADIRLRDAERDRATVTAVAARALVAADVVEAFKVLRARQASLEDAGKAMREAQEMYRKLSVTSFGMIGPRAQFDALEPLIAVTQLNQARLQQLGSVVEFNRAQFRLLTALGQPAEAPPGMTPAVPGKP